MSVEGEPVPPIFNYWGGIALVFAVILVVGVLAWLIG